MDLQFICTIIRPASRTMTTNTSKHSPTEYNVRCVVIIVQSVTHAPICSARWVFQRTRVSRYWLSGRRRRRSKSPGAPPPKYWRRRRALWPSHQCTTQPRGRQQWRPRRVAFLLSKAPLSAHGVVCRLRWRDPEVFLATGIAADAKARATRSLSAWCLDVIILFLFFLLLLYITVNR